MSARMSERCQPACEGKRSLNRSDVPDLLEQVKCIFHATWV